MTWVKTYKYKCSDCGKPRTSRFELLAQTGICMKCRTVMKVPEGQMNIFEAINKELNIDTINMNEQQEEIKEIDILVWDLETDGFSAPKNKILEIGAYVIRNGNVERMRWVLNNGTDVPEHITSINGMTNEIIDAEGRDPAECLAEFLPLFKAAKKNVTHNGISFDIPFLVNYAADVMKYEKHQSDAMFALLRSTAFDTAVHFKAKKLGAIQGSDESFISFASRVMSIRAFGLKYNLTLCAEEMGLDLNGITAHRALGDVEVTHQLYQKIHG